MLRNLKELKHFLVQNDLLTPLTSVIFYNHNFCRKGQAIAYVKAMCQCYVIQKSWSIF